MAGSARYTAVLDANTLYPAPLRDLLLSLAVEGLYHARWTARIHDEWVRNLARKRPELEPQLGALVELMNRSVPDCLVENYEGLIGGLVLPDPDDRHVLVAAIAGHADAIVACVIALRDAYRGESVKAVVVLKPASRGHVDAAQMCAWAREHMAVYKVPRAWEFVDALPMSASGKLLWRVVQAQQDAGHPGR